MTDTPIEALVARLRTERDWVVSSADQLIDEAADALTAQASELAQVKAERDAMLTACDFFDGPVSRSQFVNGQATASQQIRGAALSLRKEKPHGH